MIIEQWREAFLQWLRRKRIGAPSGWGRRPDPWANDRG